MSIRPSTSLRALLIPARYASTSSNASGSSVTGAGANIAFTPSTPRPGSSPSSSSQSTNVDPALPGSSPSSTPGHASSSPISAVASSDLVEKATSARIYTQRKTFLWNYYTHLIKRSELILLFNHDNLSAGEWSKLRRAINSIPPPLPSSTIANEEAGEKATLTVVRTGVLSSLSSSLSFPLASHLTGQRALLTSPILSPAYLAKVTNTITRTLKSLKRDNTADNKQPRLELLVGVLEGKKVYEKEALVGQVAKLPELDQLRGQVVGLLESQGRSLLGVLQAGGGGLVRTLQGLELDLKEKEKGPDTETSA